MSVNVVLNSCFVLLNRLSLYQNNKVMNTLNDVIKAFNRIISQYDKDSLEASYYRVIVNYLLLEHKHKVEVEAAKKPIYHYFMYHLPVFGNEYFEYLYHVYNPVRFAVETFDSIEVIRLS